MAIKIPGYRIIRKINHGGMSTVYLAIQISVGRVVALKVMNPGLTSDPGFNERFQREATIVGQLSHPNIIAIYDIGREENLNYIAMDYLPGGSVHDKMISGLSSAEALRVTKDIANALHHAHERGYIHRDIKPENILFRTDDSAVLTDFGVAKGMVGVSRMTHVGSVVGTPHYMSPEQARGQLVDARSDLYSLGVVFYEMLTGSLPYPGEDAVTIVLKHISAPIPTLPRQFQAYQKILDKLLAKDPAQRYQQGNEITDAIEKVENSRRATLDDITSGEKLSIFTLFNALIHATSDELYWQWQHLKNLRWSKQKGFFPEHANLATNTRSDSQPTLMATRIQNVTQLQKIINPSASIKWLSIALLSLSVSLILWCLVSVILQHKYSKTLPTLPLFIQNATATTAKLFTPNTKTLAANTAHGTNTQSNLAMRENVTPAIQHSSIPAIVQSTILPTSSSSPTTEPAIQTYALTIKVQPEKTQIKILNIPEKYKDGIELKAGRYNVEISKLGYSTKTEWIDIKNQAKEFNYILTEAPIENVNELSSKEVKVKELKSTVTLSEPKGKFTPEFIRIPAGTFMMGDEISSRSAPQHTVSITKAFYISKYEVTFSEYDIFVRATGHAQPGDNSWGREAQPVINVSWDDAQAYTQWLSKTTGKKYRLPTEAEWEYVARAGTKTRFWWGEDEQDAKGNANCRRGCYSSYSGLFGSKTAPVGNYLANKFGAYDTAGNVAEWVQDCYRDHYEKTANTSAAYEETECQKRVVRGGSTKDNAPSLASAARDYNPPTTNDAALGFRVVME